MEQRESHVFSGKRGAGLCFFPESDDEIAQRLIHNDELRRVACVKDNCPEGYDLKIGSVGFFALNTPVTHPEAEGSPCGQQIGK